MKGWKKRAYGVIKDTITGDPQRAAILNGLIAEYEARRAEKSKAKEAKAEPQPAPMSDEYLYLWVPRMEAVAQGYGRMSAMACSGENSWYCKSKSNNCPLEGTSGLCLPQARSWLDRPEVVAWKERQKRSVVYKITKNDNPGSEYGYWLNVDVADIHAIVHLDSQGPIVTKALALAAEIDAVRRP
jgi:hypothetical protein